MPTGSCWVSWTTSCRTRTTSSSSPRCMAAEDPSLSLGTPGGAGREQADVPLGPASRSPCHPWLPSSLPYPPSSLQAGKRGQVLKMSLSQAREQGKADRRPRGALLLPAAEVGEVSLWGVRSKTAPTAR